MHVISSSLPSKYRLYQAEDGTCVRVSVDALNLDAGHYRLTAEVTDSDGTAVGPQTGPHMLTHRLDQADTPLLQPSRGTPKKGDLAVENGNLYEADGDQWVDRGPVPDGACVAVCEMVCVLDREARVLVEKARRAWSRQSANQELSDLIGAS